MQSTDHSCGTARVPKGLFAKVDSQTHTVDTSCIGELLFWTCRWGTHDVRLLHLTDGGGELAEH